MQTIVINNQIIEVDKEGYLINYNDWHKDIADSMALSDGIELTANHWRIITFLQDYYKKYQIAPPIRILVRNLSKQYGSEFGNSRVLYQLFPLGPAKQACRYGGLPKPTGCI